MEESVWYRLLDEQVQEEVKKLYKTDFRFFHVDTFLNYAKTIEGFSGECTECSDFKNNINDLADNLASMISGTVASRRQFEDHLEKIRKHLRLVHGIYTKDYMLSLFSFVGIVGGSLLGFIIVLLVNKSMTFEGLIIGAFIGLIIGRIYGKIADKKLEKK